MKKIIKKRPVRTLFILTSLCFLFCNSRILEAADMSSERNEDNDISVESVKDIKKSDSIEEVGSTQYNTSSTLDDVGEASIKQELVVEDVAIPLYPVFNNEKDALENIKSECPNVLDIIAKEYLLSELSSTNWQQYYDYMTRYLESANKVEWYTEENKEYVKLLSFFDIYENKFSNQVILNSAEDKDDVEELLEDKEFLASLPYDDASKFVNEIKESENIDINTDEMACNKSTNNFSYLEFSTEDDIEQNNISNLTSVNSNAILPMSTKSSRAINYAIKYANSPNKSKYGYVPDHDCTNFASQILIEAGKAPTSKWTVFRIGPKFKYTKAWSNANNFANYWGVDCKYTRHKTFSKGIKKGDFIAYDRENDADWNHIGFVVAKGKYNSSRDYYDYKVAQHSRNYVAWATSRTNGWDYLKSTSPATVFGIIRP